MPVFDDPKKELRRLHEQLLAEQDEEMEELVEEFGEADYRDFFEEGDPEEYRQEPFIRNYSNHYGSDVRNFANGYRGDDLLGEEDPFDWEDSGEEPYALQVETRRERRRRLRGEKSETRQKGGGFLKFMLVLELMGLLGILLWWVVNVW